VFSFWRILILNERDETNSAGIIDVQSNKLERTESSLKIATNDVAQLEKERAKNAPILSMTAFMTLMLRMSFDNTGLHIGRWETPIQDAANYAGSAKLDFNLKRYGRRSVPGKLDFVASNLQFSEKGATEMEVSATFSINPRFQPTHMESSLPTIQSFMSEPVGMIDDIDSFELQFIPGQLSIAEIEAKMRSGTMPHGGVIDAQIEYGTVTLVFNSTPKEFNIPSQPFSNNLTFTSFNPAKK
jgi:hypothetical protein